MISILGKVRAKVDPSLGLQDLANAITTKILGKAKLTERYLLQRVLGIVFAAAPYASIVQDLRGRWCSCFVREAVFQLKTVRCISD